MSLRSLPGKMNLAGKRVLVRVDWNIPLGLHLVPDDSLKLERSIRVIRDLTDRGAIVVILTHLGRPQKPDPAWSTKRLLPVLKRRYKLDITFHPELVDGVKTRAQLRADIEQAEPGSIHLLENVRFCKGEEKNTKTLINAYVELGEVFINDAFASCHRKHVSVAGIASALPSYAGPSLIEEVSALTRLVKKPKKPFVAIIGGFKLSTKLPLIKTLLTTCNSVLVGGAMATALLRARGQDIGASKIEDGVESLARTLNKAKNLVLPVDYMVASEDHPSSRLRVVLANQLRAPDVVVDVGPRTIQAWGALLMKAKTIVWNGPVGVTEQTASAKGSHALAHLVALRAKGDAFGVAGGGDTLPVIFKTKTEKWFDHVSTGGGAMLEFIALQGKLPGLAPLEQK